MATFEELSVAIESQLDTLDGYLKQHLQMCKIGIMADKTDWSNPREAMPLAVAVESITCVALEAEEDEKKDHSWVKGAVVKSLVMIGRGAWIIFKGVLSLLAIITKLLSDLLWKLTELDKWMKEASRKAKAKTEEVVVDTAEKIKEREERASKAKAGNEAFNVSQSALEAAFNLDSFSVTVTEEDARKVRQYSGIKSGSSLKIDEVLGSIASSLNEDMGRLFKANENMQSNALKDVTYLLGRNREIASLLKDGLKDGTVSGHGLEEILKDVIQRQNETVSAYLDVNDDYSDLYKLFNAKEHVEVKFNQDSRKISIPTVGEIESIADSKALLTRKDNEYSSTPLTIQGSKAKFNRESYARYGMSFGEDCMAAIEDAQKHISKLANETKAVQSELSQTEKETQSLESVLKNAKVPANEQALVNAAFTVMNQSVKVQLQLLKMAQFYHAFCKSTIEESIRGMQYGITLWRVATLGGSLEKK